MANFFSDIATCAGCGCTDVRACAGGCSWLAVNRNDGTGVCSSCPKALGAWRNQQAEEKVSRHVEGQGLIPIGPTDV